MAVCLFLPYHPEQDRLLDSDFPEALWLLLVGGPLPIVSAGAGVTTILLLLTNPRAAMGPAVAWLGLLVFGYGVFLIVLGGLHGWAWLMGLAAGLWSVDVARWYPLPPRTDVQAFE